MLQLFFFKGHGGKYACAYCNGPMEACGELRSFGSLQFQYQRYSEDGKPIKRMKMYEIETQECMLIEDPETAFFTIISPPEYHLYDDMVTEVTQVLFSKYLMRTLKQL